MENSLTTNAVENIWNDFSKPLKGFIKKHVNNHQDVEDILQNVFYKVHSNIGSLKDADKIQAWVYKIAGNAIIDYYRSNKVQLDSYESIDEIQSVIEQDNNSNKEIALCVKAMIMHLPEKYKQALLLTEYQNLTQKQLGEKLGLSVSGAKSRVQRAREKLKEMLLGCCHLEFDHLGNVVDYKQKCVDCNYS